MAADSQVHQERVALEHAAHELIRTIRLTTDDLAACLERLRQVRESETTPEDHRLIVELGANGRPAVRR